MAALWQTMDLGRDDVLDRQELSTALEQGKVSDEGMRMLGIPDFLEFNIRQYDGGRDMYSDTSNKLFAAMKSCMRYRLDIKRAMAFCEG